VADWLAGGGLGQGARGVSCGLPCGRWGDRPVRAGYRARGGVIATLRAGSRAGGGVIATLRAGEGVGEAASHVDGEAAAYAEREPGIRASDASGRRRGRGRHTGKERRAKECPRVTKAPPSPPVTGGTGVRRSSPELRRHAAGVGRRRESARLASQLAHLTRGALGRPDVMERSARREGPDRPRLDRRGATRPPSSPRAIDARQGAPTCLRRP